MPVDLIKRRFDVDDYHRMAEARILTEDDRAIVQVQGSVRLDRFHEPQPE